MTTQASNPIASQTSNTVTTFSTLNELSDDNSNGTQLGYSANDKIGFYGAAPVVQATPAANTTTVAAGSTTAVYINTTFSGGSGSTAYTVGDLVAILKANGLLKA